MNTRRLALLDALSVVGLIVAAVVALLPARVQATSVAARAKTSITMPASASDVDSGKVATIVAANILSGTRHAPSVRYRSPDAEIMQAFIPPPVVTKADSTVSDSTGNADTVPALYGIVNIDGNWRALLRLSPDDASASLFKEGDRRGVYRVVSIQSDRVVVATSSGQRTLRLARTARGDSTGNSGKRP